MIPNRFFFPILCHAIISVLCCMTFSLPLHHINSVSSAYFSRINSLTLTSYKNIWSCCPMIWLSIHSTQIIEVSYLKDIAVSLRIFQCYLHVSPHNFHIFNYPQLIQFLFIIILQYDTKNKPFDCILKFEPQSDAISNCKWWSRISFIK